MIGYVLAWKSYSFFCTLHFFFVHLIIIIVQTYLKTLNPLLRVGHETMVCTVCFLYSFSDHSGHIEAETK